MRMKFTVIVVTCLFLLGGAGILLSQGAPDADGMPDISGSWLAKAKVKGYDTSGDGEVWKETVTVDVDVDQKGPSILVTIDPPDGDDIVLEGLIGDGHFWAAGEDDGSVVMMIGHVKKKGKLIKGTMFSGESDAVVEVKIAMKRPKK